MLISFRLIDGLIKICQPSLMMLSLILSFIVFIGTQTTVPAQCYPLTATPDELGYRFRANRCEGLYASNVSGESLQIVSLLEGSLAFSLNPNVVLEVSPTLNPGSNIRIRAIPLPLKTYYRMDAELGQNEVLVWPVRDVLSKINVSSARLGVYGWVGPEQDPLFIPLRVIPRGQAMQGARSLTLGVRSSVTLGRVSWRLGSLENNQCSNFGVWQNVAPVGNLVKISLTSVTAGYFCAEVQAREKNSGPWLPSLTLKIRRL